ncbi:MAG: TlpA family protein disulfide reductase [Thermoleophilia bacterium]|nr:TlpA family protein disulfide reductase [Thermoleophilia bacterium]
MGATVSLEQLRGKPVVLNLWASWCDPCRDEAPILEEVWARYRERGVVVLGLDTEDLTEKALAFAKEYGLTYPSLRDPGDDSKRKLGATGVPETWIIDADGNIAMHIIGQVTSAEQITRPLDQVLAQ